MSHPPMLPGLLPPLQPHEYIRLRRTAAGLTIEQAARSGWTRPEHRADCERNQARVEQPGFVMQHDYDIVAFTDSFRFEIDVYRQLRDEPVDHHPTVCRGCGCTSWSPCHAGDGEDCSIKDGVTCTACHERADRRQHRRAA